VLARYCDGIMIRTYGQAEVEELAKYSSVPVINGLTDFAHPCQVLADLMTVREKLSRLQGLKLCYIGDGNNMANSLIVGGLKCGMHVSVATPAGYEPHQAVLDFAQTVTGQAFTLTHDPREAAVKADVLVTDVWASMGMEEEIQKRRRDFAGFQINDEIMDLAQPHAMIQHCLPAHKGEEITEKVFEAHASEIFEEAENRLHVQKAIMYLLMGSRCVCAGEACAVSVPDVIARRGHARASARFFFPSSDLSVPRRSSSLPFDRQYFLYIAECR
jgi:ornithine carbamoyltransferase